MVFQCYRFCDSLCIGTRRACARTDCVRHRRYWESMTLLYGTLIKWIHFIFPQLLLKHTNVLLLLNVFYRSLSPYFIWCTFNWATKRKLTKKGKHSGNLRHITSISHILSKNIRQNGQRRNSEQKNLKCLYEQYHIYGEWLFYPQ